MNVFINREKALEAKFQHEQFLEYKILARRNRLFGLWAAHYLQYVNDQAEAYARTFVGGDYSTLQGDMLIAHIIKDFLQNKIDVSEHRIRRQLQHCYQDASVQILNE